MFGHKKPAWEILELPRKNWEREVRKQVEVLLDPYPSMAEKGDALVRLDELTREYSHPRLAADT